MSAGFASEIIIEGLS